MVDQAHREAEELLPCVCDKVIVAEFGHVCEPCKHRPAVAAKLRELHAENERLTKDRNMWIADDVKQNDAFGRAEAEKVQFRAEIDRVKVADAKKAS